ncbi:hypothetical protein [Aliivibrio sp. EL58]|jgi:hypothetical protein|uniref:hypothetical protein n=1 Tax=Aliivibrio sp. EL58 TaxID=2107582 RepID=UPI000EFB891B|nr:hypothetical protein [Aliivibrio sp. EL58]
MTQELEMITNLEDLETFIVAAENGGFGLTNVAGIAMATNNKDGRRFVAVLDDKHQLLLSRWVTEEVFQTGQDLVRNGSSRTTH